MTETIYCESCDRGNRITTHYLWTHDYWRCVWCHRLMWLGR